MKPQPCLKFREDRATQIAALLITKEGGSINIVKLIKLMYYVDRAAIIRWGYPVTSDSHYSLPNGPILSFTLNLINEDMDGSYWTQYISSREAHKVCLLESPSTDALSEAEISLIDEIYDQLGDLKPFQLVELSHLLPEWEDPQGSRRPISYRTILKSEGYSEEDIEDIFSDLDADTAMSALAGD